MPHGHTVAEDAADNAIRCSAIGSIPPLRVAPYVDTAHRAALLYSFALLLVATFVELSGWSTLVNALAAGAMAFYFFAAVASYALHGRRRDTTNQFHPPVRGAHAFMWALIATEIGG